MCEHLTSVSFRGLQLVAIFVLIASGISSTRDRTTALSRLTPPVKQCVSSSSEGNLTFHCEVSNGSVAWTFNATNSATDDDQVHLTANNTYKVEYFSNQTGVIFRKNKTNASISELILTQQARHHFGRKIEIGCLPVSEFDVDYPKYAIYTYDLSAPTNVKFVGLILEWEVPTLPPVCQAVTIHAIVQLTNISSDETEEIHTSGTSLNLSDVEQFNLTGYYCSEFVISLFLSDDNMGNSSKVSITKWLPVSLDVSSIVATPDLSLNGSVELIIKFRPVHVSQCSIPVLNYTVTIATLNVTLMVPNATTCDDHICVTINEILGLRKDQAVDYTVTACNSMMCKSTERYTAYTTDVYNPTVYWSRNSKFILLTCEFPDGSKASGCLFNLTKNITQSDEVEIVRKDSKIDSPHCTRKACLCVTLPSDPDYMYLMNLQASAEAVLDGEVTSGSISVPAVLREDVSIESDVFLGCEEQQPLNLSGIAVFAVLIAVILFSVGVTSFVIVKVKRKRNGCEPHGGGGDGGNGGDGGEGGDGGDGGEGGDGGDGGAHVQSKKSCLPVKYGCRTKTDGDEDSDNDQEDYSVTFNSHRQNVDTVETPIIVPPRCIGSNEDWLGKEIHIECPISPGQPVVRVCSSRVEVDCDEFIDDDANTDRETESLQLVHDPEVVSGRVKRFVVDSSELQRTGLRSRHRLRSTAMLKDRPKKSQPRLTMTLRNRK